MRDPVSAILDHKGRHVHSVAPRATVAEAVRVMNGAKIGCLVVLEEERPVGIFTERDVLVRVVDAGLDPRTTRVAEVMTLNPFAIRPATTVEEAMIVVTEKRCRHLPVIEGGELSGLVSIGDLTRWVVRDQRGRIDDLVSYITGGIGGG